jgi:hypothetical protein
MYGKARWNDQQTLSELWDPTDPPFENGIRKVWRTTASQWPLRTHSSSHSSSENISSPYPSQKKRKSHRISIETGQKICEALRGFFGSIPASSRFWSAPLTSIVWPRTTTGGLSVPADYENSPAHCIFTTLGFVNSHWILSCLKTWTFQHVPTCMAVAP